MGSLSPFSPGFISAAPSLVGDVGTCTARFIEFCGICLFLKRHVLTSLTPVSLERSGFCFTPVVVHLSALDLNLKLFQIFDELAHVAAFFCRFSMSQALGMKLSAASWQISAREVQQYRNCLLPSSLTPPSRRIGHSAGSRVCWLVK